MSYEGYMLGLRMEFAMTRRNSNAVISGITGDGPPADDGRNLFLLPPNDLWTRHMAGVRELERDRRRYGR